MSTNYFQTSQFYGFKDALSSAVDGFFFSCPRQELKKPMDGSIIKDRSLLPKQPKNFFSFRLLLKVARYSFSGSIPPKFEYKLRRLKQSFGKIATTVVLGEDENLL